MLNLDITKVKMETRVYGPVYATSSRGDVKMWSAEVREYFGHSRITYTYGLETGKKQTQIVNIREGKNIGKSNETTL